LLPPSLVALILLLIGCGGGSSPTKPTPVPPNPIPVVAILGDDEGTEGQIIKLTAVTSVLGGTIDSIEWVQTEGAQSILTNINTDKVTITLPYIPDIENFNFKVIVTDNLGTKAESTHVIKVNPKLFLSVGESCPSNHLQKVGVNSNISILSPFDVSNVDLNKVELICNSNNINLDYEIVGNKIVFTTISGLPSYSRCTFTLEDSAISSAQEKNHRKIIHFITSDKDKFEYSLSSETNLTADIPLGERNSRFPLKHFVYDDKDYLLWTNSHHILNLTSWNIEGVTTIEVARIGDYISDLETFETTNDIAMFDDGDNKLFLLPTYYKYSGLTLIPVDLMFVKLNMLTKTADLFTRTTYFESSVQNSMTKIDNDIYMTYRAHANAEYDNKGVIKVSSDNGRTFVYTDYHLPDNTIAKFLNSEDKVRVILTNKSSTPGIQDYFSISDFNEATGELNELYQYKLPSNRFLFKLSITDKTIYWCESASYGGVVSDDTICKISKLDLDRMTVTSFKTFDKNSYNFSILTSVDSNTIFKLSYDDLPLIPIEIYDVGSSEPKANGILELDDGEPEDVYFSPTGLDVLLKRNTSDPNNQNTSDLLLQKYSKNPTCS